jgi:hypothetical protein
LLSRFRIKRVSHATLSYFFAQFGAEVNEMANENLTKLERDLMLIEQTLIAMMQIEHTVAQLGIDWY